MGDFVELDLRDLLKVSVECVRYSGLNAFVTVVLSSQAFSAEPCRMTCVIRKNSARTDLDHAVAAWDRLRVSHKHQIDEFARGGTLDPAFEMFSPAGFDGVGPVESFWVSTGYLRESAVPVLHHDHFSEISSECLSGQVPTECIQKASIRSDAFTVGNIHAFFLQPGSLSSEHLTKVNASSLFGCVDGACLAPIVANDRCIAPFNAGKLVVTGQTPNWPLADFSGVARLDMMANSSLPFPSDLDLSRVPGTFRLGSFLEPGSVLDEHILSVSPTSIFGVLPGSLVKKVPNIAIEPIVNGSNIKGSIAVATVEALRVRAFGKVSGTSILAGTMSSRKVSVGRAMASSCSGGAFQVHESLKTGLGTLGRSDMHDLRTEVAKASTVLATRIVAEVRASSSTCDVSTETVASLLTGDIIECDLASHGVSRARSCISGSFACRACSVKNIHGSVVGGVKNSCARNIETVLASTHNLFVDCAHIRKFAVGATLARKADSLSILGKRAECYSIASAKMSHAFVSAEGPGNRIRNLDCRYLYVPASVKCFKIDIRGAYTATRSKVGNCRTGRAAIVSLCRADSTRVWARHDVDNIVVSGDSQVTAARVETAICSSVSSSQLFARGVECNGTIAARSIIANTINAERVQVDGIMVVGGGIQWMRDAIDSMIADVRELEDRVANS